MLHSLSGSFQNLTLGKNTTVFSTLYGKKSSKFDHSTLEMDTSLDKKTSHMTLKVHFWLNFSDVQKNRIRKVTVTRKILLQEEVQ